MIDQDCSYRHPRFVKVLNDNLILKVFPKNPGGELNMIHSKITPKVHDIIEDDIFYYVVMEKIKNELWKISATDEMFEKCKDLLIEILENKYVHLDFTPNNILYDDNNKFYVIDFEYSKPIKNIDTSKYIKKVKDLPIDISFFSNLHDIEFEALQESFRVSEECQLARNKISEIISKYDY